MHPGAEKKQAIVVGAVETMWIQNSFSGCMFCVDTCVDVTKGNEFFCLRHSRQEVVQVIIKFVSSGARAAGLPGSKPKGSTAEPDQEVKELPQNTAPKRKLKNFPLTTYSVKIGKR
ncbi:hypothetical protein SprV_0301015700 [Sparganum proliferum]